MSEEISDDMEASESVSSRVRVCGGEAGLLTARAEYLEEKEAKVKTKSGNLG